MPYSNVLSIEEALYFELFDDIKYEWLKEVLDPKREDENDFEVEIEDIPNDENTEDYKTTQFTFELRKIDDVRFGETHYKTKTFVVKQTYGYNSPYAMSLGNNYQSTDDEEEEEEDDCGSDDDTDYMCPNLHWGGQYGCDLCSDLKDSKNPEMLPEWLDKHNKYSYKLHKKWAMERHTKAKEEQAAKAELKCPHPKVDEEDNLCHDCFHKTCEKGECYCEDCDEPKMCTPDKCYCDPSDLVGAL